MALSENSLSINPLLLEDKDQDNSVDQTTADTTTTAPIDTSVPAVDLDATATTPDAEPTDDTTEPAPQPQQPAQQGPAPIQIRMSDGKILQAAAGTDPAKIRQAAQTYEDHLKSQAVDQSSGRKELVKGAISGLESTATLLGQGIPTFFRAAAEKMTGQDFGSADKIKQLAVALDAIENNPKLKASVGTYKDINSVDSAIQYFTSALGQAAPSILTSFGAGTVLKAGAEYGAKKLVENAAEDITKQAIIKAGNRGMAAGLVGASIAQETPSTLVQTFAETGQVAPGTAAIAGTAKGILDALSDKVTLGIGEHIPGNVLKRIAVGGAKSALVEGATEGVQQSIDELASMANDQNGTKKFNVDAVIDNALQGAAGGLGIGGFTHGLPSKAEIDTSKGPPSRGASFGLKEKDLGEDKPQEEAQAKPADAANATTPTPTPAQQEALTQASAQIDSVNADKAASEAKNAVTRPQGGELITRSPAKAMVEETAKPKQPAPPEHTIGDKRDISLLAQVNPDAAVEQATGKGIVPTEGSKFNLFTNVKDNRVSGFVKSALDLVGHDEDTMLVDLNDADDDSWVPVSAAQKYLTKLKPQMLAATDAGALAASFVDDNGNVKHIIGIRGVLNPNKPELVRKTVHEVGHIITNRFVQRDPVMKQNLQNAWQKALKEKGLYTDGLSYNDIGQMLGSWSFGKGGLQIQAPTGANLEEKTRFQPVELGNTAPSGDAPQADKKYRTAFDEFMAENIARWYQSQEKPLTVVDKFFKAVGDMYRKFLSTAQQYGLMPNESVKNFMDDLVLQARGQTLAAKYNEEPVAGMQELRAYHGTPHRFSEFSLDKVGTGEGYQAFGWGLYFTNSKAIAKFYKEKLSGGKKIGILSKNGEEYTMFDVDNYATDNNWFESPDDKVLLRNVFMGASQGGLNTEEVLYTNSKDKAEYELNKYKNGLAEYEKQSENKFDSVRKVIQDEIDRWQKNVNANEKALGFVRLLKKAGFSEVQTHQGAVYEVEIPDEDKYLDWDKPVHQDVISKILSQSGLSGRVMDYFKNQWSKELPKGEEVYGAITDFEGSPKNASKFLNSLEIKGIKYPAGTMSGIQSGSTNYVLFDSAAIQINSVYDDDALFAKLKAQEENKEDDPVATYKKRPFAGYDLNPKVFQAAKDVLNTRTKGILGSLITNMKADTKVNDTTATQLYATIGQALTGAADTYLPEAYRGLFKSNLVSDGQRMTMRSKPSRNAIADALGGFYGMTARDIRQFGLTDVEAEAYKVYNESKGPNSTDRHSKFSDQIPDSVKGVYDSMNNIINGLKNDLNDQGIIKMDDVVQGKDNAVPPDFNDMMKEAQITRAASRRRMLENQGLLKQFIQEDNTKLGKFGQWFWTPRFVARYSPLFADVKRSVDERRGLITQYVHQFYKGTQNFFALKDEELNHLANIMDEQRRLSSKATINDQGLLEFKREVDGKIRKYQLESPELSKIYTEVQGVMQMIPNLREFILRSGMSPIFAKTGMGFTPTRADFDHYKAAFEDGHLLAANKVSPREMDTLERYFDTLDNFNAMRNRDYVPHIRFGTRGQTVKDANGKQVFFKTYETDDNGKPIKESYDEFKKEIAKYEGDPKYRVSKDFQLTYDNIFNQLGKNEAMTMEMLTQLLNSGSEKLFTETQKKAFGSPEDYIEGRINKKGFVKHDIKSEDVAGFSKDWRRSISAYMNNAAYFIGNMEYEPKVMTTNTRLQNNAKSDRLKDFSKKYVDSIMNPTDSYQTMRAIQYFYAMGGNISSAIIQSTSALTFMPSVLNIATNSMFKAVWNMGRATKVLPYFYSSKNNIFSESIFDFGNKEIHDKLVAQGKLTKEQSNTILDMYNQGTMQALFTSEFVGAPSDYTTKGLKGKLRQRVGEWTNAAGFMMRSFEEGSRGMQAMASILTLSDGDNLNRMHNNLMANDKYYQNKVNSTASKLPDRSYMVQWLIEKSLGEFGREGRAAYQNTALAVTAMPFSTYPWQMILNSYELLSGKYGAEGRKAGIWAMATVAATAGVWGLPGAMLFKETAEILIQQLTGEDDDLDQILRKYILEFAPKELGIQDLISGGVFDAYTPYAIGSRLKYDVPLATAVAKSIREGGSATPTDFLGVYGTLAEAPIKAWQAYSEGNDPLSIINALVPNVGLQNVYKGFLQYPEGGKQYRGQFSLLPGQAPPGKDPAEYAGEFHNELTRALGFKPSVQNTNEMEIDAAKLLDTKYDVALKPMRTRIENAMLQLKRADSPEDRTQAQLKLREEIQNLVQFMNDKKVPNPGAAVKRVLQDSQLESLLSLQGHNSGVAKRTYRLQTRRNLNDINRLYGSD